MGKIFEYLRAYGQAYSNLAYTGAAETVQRPQDAVKPARPNHYIKKRAVRWNGPANHQRGRLNF